MRTFQYDLVLLLHFDTRDESDPIGYVVQNTILCNEDFQYDYHRNNKLSLASCTNNALAFLTINSDVLVSRMYFS